MTTRHAPEKVGSGERESADATEGSAHWWIRTLAMPLALCVVPVLFEMASHERTERENQFRLYTELLSKREEADMNVRRGIFEKVFDKYLPPGSKDIETRLVGLELMATNFHESLDVSPLFWQLDREVMQDHNAASRARYLKELARIAGVAKAKQIEGLEIAGCKQEIGFDLDLDEKAKKDVEVTFELPRSKGARPASRRFKVGLIKSDVDAHKLQLQLTYSIPTSDVEPAKQLVIWADLYDFPLMSFSRLSDEERVALVLTRLDAESRSATVTLVYYPSSRSGTRDKPFIDEVLSRLGRS
jgi:hypothetical protein